MLPVRATKTRLSPLHGSTRASCVCGALGPPEPARRPNVFWASLRLFSATFSLTECPFWTYTLSVLSRLAPPISCARHHERPDVMRARFARQAACGYHKKTRTTTAHSSATAIFLSDLSTHITSTPYQPLEPVVHIRVGTVCIQNYRF